MATKTASRDELLALAGSVLPSSDWTTITQDQINTFADCTGDHQFIHVDEEKAKQTPLGGTIAHGFLTIALIPKLIEDSLIVPEDLVFGMNYGFDKIRFLAPVHAGKRVRLNGKILSVYDKGGNRYLIKTGVSIEIEGADTPALSAEWLNMYFCS